MSEWHPREFDLAQVSEKEVGEELAEHLRWCSQCRGIAADYEWLEGEIAGAFEAGLEDVPVPQSRWEGVHGRLRPRHRRTVGGQLLAIAGAAAMACLMLVRPSLMSGDGHAGEVLAPHVVAVRVPASTDHPRAGRDSFPSLTMTPASSVSSGDRAESLPFVPPPEPPEPDA